MRQRAAVERNERLDAHAAAAEVVQREAVRLEEARARRRREERSLRPLRAARELRLHRQPCVQGAREPQYRFGEDRARRRRRRIRDTAPLESMGSTEREVHPGRACGCGLRDGAPLRPASPSP